MISSLAPLHSKDSKSNSRLTAENAENAACYLKERAPFSAFSAFSAFNCCCFYCPESELPPGKNLLE
jgi:hypothetical protein